jgi:hypothetical protein
MSQLIYLRTKTCAVCTKRLDCTYKRGVRTVKNDDIIQSLNSVKNRILTKKGKEINDTIIKKGDTLCGACLAYTYKYQTTTNQRLNSATNILPSPSPNSIRRSLRTRTSTAQPSFSYDNPVASTSAITQPIPSLPSTSSQNTTIITRSRSSTPDLSNLSMFDQGNQAMDRITVTIPRAANVTTNCIVCKKLKV